MWPYVIFLHTRIILYRPWFLIYFPFPSSFLDIFFIDASAAGRSCHCQSPSRLLLLADLLLAPLLFFADSPMFILPSHVTSFLHDFFILNTSFFAVHASFL
jgi:hypothetical protein